MSDLPADAGIMAAAIIAEALCTDGLVDRDYLMAQAMALAEAATAPPPLAAGLRAFAICLGDRTAARLFPSRATRR